MACNVDADAVTVYRAVAAGEAVRGWFISEAEVG
jgi:hypothetical protein